MKKSSFFVLLLILVTQFSMAQKKKVAVVTFYANKVVGFSDLGIGSEELIKEIFNLRDNPDFNLTPILNKYHDTFFNEYAKELPFELLSENEVCESEGYAQFQPKYDLKKYEARDYLLFGKYKYIYEGFMGQANEIAMAKLFAEKADGVMFVSINFDLMKGFGVGGTATVKVRATTRLALYDKQGNKVFAFSEGENSKKTGVMIKGIPVLSPEKILPMCDSALTELMGDLSKRIAKIVKKTAVKL